MFLEGKSDMEDRRFKERVTWKAECLRKSDLEDRMFKGRVTWKTECLREE